MKYKSLIRDAWEFTQHNKKLIIYYGFLPSILTTVTSVGYIGYQFFSFKRSMIFDNADTSFFMELLKFIFKILTISDTWRTPIIVMAVLVSLLYFFVPTILEGGLIQIIARIKHKQKVRLGDGIYYGMISFLPLLEFHTIIKIFNFIFLFGVSSSIIRNLGMDFYMVVFPIIIFIGILGLILGVLFVYTEYFIVIDQFPILISIKKSCLLVLQHLRQTLLLIMIMGLLLLRIVINILIVLLIPLIVIILVGFIISVGNLITAIIVGGLVGSILLLATAYLSGSLHVFITTVWVLTFLELSSAKELTARESDK